MSSATVTRWARAFVVLGVLWFVAWNLAVLAGAGRRTAVVLGLYGFVFHTVFGKAYSLIPSYFDRELATPRAAAAQLPPTVLGTAALAVAAAGDGPDWLAPAGRALWAIGVAIFLGAVVLTIRDNLTGRETATSAANRDRRRTDRLANAVVPIALAYLAAGSVLPLADAVAGSLPTAGPPQTHLLAAGSAALLVFGLGFRLLPRFLVAEPRPTLVRVVLPAGAVAPALLAWDFLGGPVFLAGALLQVLALVGFGVAVLEMLAASDRRRPGFAAVGLAAVAGVVLALLGAHLAFAGVAPGVPDAHARVAVLGFLGLMIVGVSYQFYPPGISSVPGIGDRTALAAIGVLAAGVALEGAGLATGYDGAVRPGRALALVGALAHAATIVALFVERHGPSIGR